MPYLCCLMPVRISILFFMALAGVFLALQSQAQQTAELPATQDTARPPANLFRGKNIAVYLSKRNLTFSEEYYKMLSHYVQEGDTLGMSEEDIRLGVIVKLGNDLTRIVHRKMGADSAYFLNGVTELANLFIRHYQARSLNISPLISKMPPRTEYILILDGITLTGEKRDAVYAVSNIIASEKRYVRTARIEGRLYDVKARRMLPGLVFNYDQDLTTYTQQYFRGTDEKYPALQVLSRMLNPFLVQLFRTLPQQP